MRTLLLTALGAALLAGCTRIDSAAIRTAAVTARFSVLPGNDGTSTVTGTLFVGLNPLTLSAADRVIASSGSDTAVMVEERDFWGATTFTATLPTEAPGAPVTVIFQRGEEDITANLATVIPSRFELAPVVAPNASRSSSIRLVWDTPAAGNESMRWEASGNCIEGVSEAIPAGATSATIAAGRLRSLDEARPETCKVTLKVSRSITGSVDGSLASGSSITASRTLSTSLTLAP